MSRRAHDEPLSVLYVDGDERARARLVDAAAEVDDVSVATAPNLGDALELLAESDSDLESEPGRRFACVVSVQTLPDGTGLDLLDRIRSRDGEQNGNGDGNDGGDDNGGGNGDTSRDADDSGTHTAHARTRQPFVLYPRDGSERVAAEATRLGVSSYLPQSADGETDGELFACVRKAVAEYDRQTELVRTSEIFDSLLDGSPIELYVKDDEARAMRLSKAAYAEVFTDPIGKTDPERAGRETRAEAYRSYEKDVRVIETGEPIVEEDEPYLENVEDVETVWKRSTRVPWRDREGTVRGVIGLSQNVTEVKRLEEELHRQNRRLERFASFATHDLRNPLNIAQGYLEYGIETDDEESLRRALEAVEQLEALIDDLLTTARTDLGKPSVEPLELAPLVDQSWEAVGVDGATCRSRIPEGTIVWADEFQLRQLLENLFKNAIVHAGPDVDVVVTPTETGFSVQDDGPGISDEERETVLEYGYTTTDGGTGIGLAIVNQVIETHDWTLSIGEGSSGGARFDVGECLAVTRPVAIDGTDGESIDGGGTGGDPTPVELASATDVGGATPPGTSRYDPETGEWTVCGGGANVWYDTDECHFRYAQLEGDARIVARLVDLEPVSTYSKAGLAIRAGPESGSPLGFVGLTDGRESEVIWRGGPDSYLVSTQLECETEAPHWYRMDRFGRELTAYHSFDGEEWIPIDQRPIEIERGETVSVGLLVCSLDPSRTCTGVYDDVSVLEL